MGLSANILSADPGTPILTALDLPAVVDLGSGETTVTIRASGMDDSRIDSVVIWFDRDISYSLDLNDPYYSDWPMGGLYGYGTDDWSDGSSSQTFLFGPDTAPGMVDIALIWIEDIDGNRHVYSNDDLRELGFRTSFLIRNDPVEPAPAHVALLPETITLTEGQSTGLTLKFLGLTSQDVSYIAYTTTRGGTADQADFGAISQSEVFTLSATLPQDIYRSFLLAGYRDNRTEATETFYLVVELADGVLFADGGSLQVIEIRILDDNRITGGSGADILRGTSAAENLTGKGGNDLYFVTPGDRVIEAAGGGNDTIYSNHSRTLEAHVESLVLTGNAPLSGFGNGQANRLVGNGAGNLLNGGAGADTMLGGAGNDIYVRDNPGDIIIEQPGAGHDVIHASVSTGLPAHVEDLVLTGNGTINGTGNNLVNRIIGNGAANVLNGGPGGDLLAGGGGHDQYVRDHLGDRIIEGPNAGTDTVRASVSTTLTAHVENLHLLGGAAINAIGNNLANRLVGNAAANVLNGAAGKDLLIAGAGNDRLLGGPGRDDMNGGAGADHFVFRALSDSGVAAVNRDLIRGFSHAQGDRIDLRMIDANLTQPGNQAFKMIGAAGFSGSAGELKIQHSGNATIVFADVNGDRHPDMSIALLGHVQLSASDFFL